MNAAKYVFRAGMVWLANDRSELKMLMRNLGANGRELTEKDLETFRLDSPVVREILANLNREVTEGIRQREKKDDD